MSGDSQYTEFYQAIQENFDRLVRSGDNEIVSWQNIFEYMKKSENAEFLRDLAEDTALVVYGIIYDRVEEEQEVLP